MTFFVRKIVKNIYWNLCQIRSFMCQCGSAKEEHNAHRIRNLPVAMDVQQKVEKMVHTQRSSLYILPT